MAQNQPDTSSEAAPSVQAPPLFPIVGIGASAAGLAPTLDLLRHLGSKPGVAVVVVHHLDPTHESSLPDILSKASQIPVHTASDGALVEQNHVYVVPPNAGLLIEGGVLKLTPRIELRGRHLPIDHFFESLATDRTVYAVGVVLSGTGMDGSQGIKAIKTEGGITFAQDATAEYRSMPDSAIMTGCVDFILNPEGIALELVRIGEYASPLSAAMRGGQSEADFRRILISLRKATGVDFTHYKRATVRRRVQRRVLVHGLSTLPAYGELLESSPQEAVALCEEILIHVTSFLRDPEAFEALRVSVFPKLLENRPRDASIRIWVPGCSSGEEVYSLAICLLEFLSDANASDVPLKLFGTDVSLSAVDKARAGTYDASIEQVLSPGRLQRFFTRLEGGSYRIRKEVRDLCVFAKHDLTRDPPFSGMDLVSCRNLMIYFGADLQARLIPLFHYALKEPGFLLLGASETARGFPGFATLDPKNKVYIRTSAAPRMTFDLSDARYGETTDTPIIASSKASGPLDVHREADRIVLAEFAPPGVVITDDLAIVQFRGKMGPFLEPTPGVASFDLLRMVKEELRLPLRQVVDEARTKRATARRTDLHLGFRSSASRVEIEVIPFAVASSTQRFFVVLFKEISTELEQVTAGQQIEEDVSNVEAELAQELASTRNYLQSVIEQLEAGNEELKAANEEIVSSNEELRSTNEELQMAKEELQATNEELRTVNEEMAVRNAEGTRLNDDLTNLISCVEIPIIICGRDSRLSRFTPAAARLFHLVASDIGRPIHDIRPLLHASEFAEMIEDVLAHLGVVGRTVQDQAGHWYQVTGRPYLTTDRRIDGAVIVVMDITSTKQAEQLITRARDYAESIVDTVREGLVVLDQDLRIKSANRAFERICSVTSMDLQGRLLDEIGNREWSIPELKQRLRNLGSGGMFEDVLVEQKLDVGGIRTFILNARRIEPTSTILLAIEDVTDKQRAEAAARRTELAFRELLAAAAEPIVMCDGNGNIVFSNQAAEKVFGVTSSDLLGSPLAALAPKLPGQSDALPVPWPPGHHQNLLGRKKDGSQFPIEVVVTSIERDDGPLTVCFVTDTTLRSEADRRLAEYQKKLQQMAFDAAVVGERERRRIAADLHDRIGQSLALAQIKLAAMRAELEGPSRTATDEAIDLLERSIEDTRSLTFELSPRVLYELGLKEALLWLIDDIEKRHGLHVELQDDSIPKVLDDVTASMVFRSVRELLMNVFKHAKAPAKVSLQGTDDHLEIEVEDKGIGFTPSEMGAGSKGFGLFSVREQIERLGGKVDIVSAPRRGTRVTLRVPLKIETSPESSRPERQGEN